MSAVPATRERVAATPRYRVVTRRKTSVVPAVLTRCFAFATIACAAYAGSTLMGMVKMEQARNAARLAGIKSAAVTERARILKAEVDGLKDFDSIGRWASANGFLAPGQTALPRPPIASIPEDNGAQAQ